MRTAGVDAACSRPAIFFGRSARFGLAFSLAVRCYFARSIASRIRRLASSASPQPSNETHFPSSRSL
jgi:hypothetical protein